MRTLFFSLQVDLVKFDSAHCPLSNRESVLTKAGRFHSVFRLSANPLNRPLPPSISGTPTSRLRELLLSQAKAGPWVYDSALVSLGEWDIGTWGWDIGTWGWDSGAWEWDSGAWGWDSGASKMKMIFVDYLDVGCNESWTASLVWPKFKLTQITEIVLLRSYLLNHVHRDIPYKIRQKTVGWTPMPGNRLRIDHVINRMIDRMDVIFINILYSSMLHSSLYQ